MTTGPSSHDASVQALADEVRASPALANAPRLLQLFDYLWARSQAPDSARPVQYQVATEAFRVSEAFDPAARSLVRAHASRLRHILGRHAAQARGRGQPSIEMAPRGYRLFVKAPVAAATCRPTCVIHTVKSAGLGPTDRSLAGLVGDWLVAAARQATDLPLEGPVPGRSAASRADGAALESHLHREEGGLVLTLRLHAFGRLRWAGFLEAADAAGLRRKTGSIVALLLGDLGVLDRVIQAQSQPVFDPANPESALMVAKAYEQDYSEHAYQVAMEALEGALAAEPTNPRLLTASALLRICSHGEYFQRHSGPPREALTRLARAVALGGETPFSRYASIYAACLGDDPASFERMARRALADPAFPPSLAIGLVTNLVFLRREKPADMALATRLAAGLAAYPRVLHVALALRSLRKRDAGEALAHLAECALPNHWFTLLVKGLATERRGDLEASRLLRRELLGQCPELPACKTGLLRRGLHPGYAGELADWVDRV
jgi:hypothetical protein